MKKKSSVLSPATDSDERSLVSVTENQHDEVVVRGKKFRIRWMHPGTSSWISRLVLEEGNDDKVTLMTPCLFRSSLYMPLWIRLNVFMLLYLVRIL